MIDDHDQSDKRHDIATFFSRDTKTLIQEKGKGHLIDHQCQIDNEENQIFLILFGYKHILENTDDVDRDLFCFSQKFIRFWKSSNNKEDINQGKKETDDKRHFDSISKQSSSYCRTDNKSYTKYCSEKSKIGSTLFMIYSDIAENRLDRADITRSSAIDYPCNQIDPNIP